MVSDAYLVDDAYKVGITSGPIFMAVRPKTQKQGRALSRIILRMVSKSTHNSKQFYNHGKKILEDSWPEIWKAHLKDAKAHDRIIESFNQDVEA